MECYYIGFTNSLGCVQDTEDNGDDILKGLEVDISTRRREKRNSRPSQQPELASQGKTKWRKWRSWKTAICYS